MNYIIRNFFLFSSPELMKLNSKMVACANADNCLCNKYRRKFVERM